MTPSQPKTTRLVIEFVVSDGCTFSCTATFPIEYESAEAFIVDFEQAAMKAWAAREYEFKFNEVMFPTDAFFPLAMDNPSNPNEFIPPAVMTVDEWFKCAR